MKHHALLGSLALAAAAAVFTPVAAADCDIRETKCYKNDGKCNIKFRNRTGVEDKTDRNSRLNQRASAQIIRVKAVKDNGKAAGNIINIEAGTSKTMNLDKKWKKEFARIRISSPTMAAVDGVTMSCDHVLQVLNGNGTCKVFYGIKQRSNDDRKYRYQLGYQCDGGNLGGPN